jgi:hypothetical protein
MKLWTTHERKAAQARAFAEQREYILPIRLDQTEIPGILPTLAYLSWHNEPIESIAHIILEKLENRSRKSKEEYLDESRDCYNKGYCEKALIASEQAIRIDPNDSYVHYHKGEVLQGLRRYKEALAAFERAIQLYRDNDQYYFYDVYCSKGETLTSLEWYKERVRVVIISAKLCVARVMSFMVSNATKKLLLSATRLFS